MSRLILGVCLLVSLGGASASAGLIGNRDNTGADNLNAQTVLRHLADTGDVKAQYRLCLMEAEGIGGPQDYSDAIKWCRAAADQGDSDAQYNLGLIYDYWHGDKPDHAEAAKWYRKAAEQGRADAAYDLGSLYETGRGVKQDYSEALKWLTRAGDQGDAGAQAKIGFIYEKGGDGFPRDDLEALRYYRKAADLGDSFAQFALMRIYGADHIPPQDAEKVARWRAERGRQDAYVLAHWYYAYKMGNYVVAKRGFQALADTGNAVGQQALGNLYDEGKGVHRDASTAAQWYMKAAEGGNAPAQFRLAEMYETGEGVDRNLVQAYKWFALSAPHYQAADDEHKGRAIRQLGLLAANMDPAEIEKAKKLASEWVGNR